MKRLLGLSVLCFCTLCLFAQKQQGYVKTKGRIVNGKHIPGTGLPGATVRIKGGGNVGVKNNDGSFVFNIPAKAFLVQSVTKKGYELVDIDVLKKHYQYSGNPIYLVMETPEQQMADLLEAEEKISRSLREQLNKSRQEIQRLKDNNRITESDYRQKMDKLIEEQKSNKDLIDGMAKEYAQMDYDQMNDFNRKICTYILNGELNKADSLLNSKGDIKSEISFFHRLHKTNIKEKEELALRQKNLKKSTICETNMMESLAQRCYNKYEISFLKHQIDSVCYYLELRASLDTTRIEWQDYTAMVLELTGYCKKALPYRLRIINLYKSRFGENSELTAQAYQDLAQTYSLSSDDMKALDFLFVSLNILKSIPDKCNLKIAKTYNSIGKALTSLRWTSRAITSFNQAIDVWRSINNNEGLADSYNNLGDVYLDSDEYDNALNCYYKADSLYSLSDTLSKKYKGDILKNIGEVYYAERNYNLAVKFLKSSLDFKTKKGVEESLLSFDMKTIGDVYMDMKYFDKALYFYKQSLDMRKKYFGDNHYIVAWSYRDIGNLYLKQKEYEKALEYHNRSHKIILNNYDDYSAEMARSYMRLGHLYAIIENFNDALRCFEKGLSIRLAIFDEYNQDVAMSYEAVGGACLRMDLFDESLYNYKKAQSIYSSLNDGEHPWTTSAEKGILMAEYEKCIKENNAKEFQKEYCFCLVFNDKTEQNIALDLSGEYVLLEFEDWTYQSHTSLFKKTRELRGKSKNIVAMKNGVIKCYHFVEKIEGDYVIKKMGKDSISNIMKAYNHWKRTK